MRTADLEREMASLRESVIINARPTKAAWPISEATQVGIDRSNANPREHFDQQPDQPLTMEQLAVPHGSKLRSAGGEDRPAQSENIMETLHPGPTLAPHLHGQALRGEAVPHLRQGPKEAATRSAMLLNDRSNRMPKHQNTAIHLDGRLGSLQAQLEQLKLSTEHEKVQINAAHRQVAAATAAARSMTPEQHAASKSRTAVPNASGAEPAGSATLLLRPSTAVLSRLGASQSQPAEVIAH